MAAKVLLLDIETSPIVADVWGLRDQNVGLSQIVEPPRVIAVGAKWMGRRGGVWWRDEYHQDRESMLTGIRDLLDQADVAIHYNGNNFDIPWLYGEWAKEDIEDPEPFKNIDLYRAARKIRLPSYKLEYVARHFGIGGKVQHSGHVMWAKCLRGDEKERAKAWNEMRRYGKRDVTLLEPLFPKLARFTPGTVNFAVYGDLSGRDCPKCPSAGTLIRRGTAYTAQRAFPQYRCSACGGWSRDTKASWAVDTTGVAAR